MTAAHRQRLLTLLAAGAAALLAMQVNPADYSGGRARDESLRQLRNTSALANMLGAFRTSMSDMLYIKTERYLHGGVIYLPHHGSETTGAEAMAAEVAEHQSEVGTGDADHAEPEEHSGIPTLIPEHDRDFRGWIGELHRRVKPWRDPDLPHIHTDGRQLLPWFRVMTLSDPHYIPGYAAGGFWLQQQDPDAARAFIEEGIAKNPDAFQLYVSRGVLLLSAARRQRAEDETADTTALRQAAQQDFQHAADLAIDQRPEHVDPDAYDVAVWTRYMENDFLAACNMDLLLSRQLGDEAGARTRQARYLRYLPDLTLAQ